MYLKTIVWSTCISSLASLHLKNIKNLTYIGCYYGFSRAFWKKEKTFVVKILVIYSLYCKFRHDRFNVTLKLVFSKVAKFGKDKKVTCKLYISHYTKPKLWIKRQELHKKVWTCNRKMHRHIAKWFLTGKKIRKREHLLYSLCELAISENKKFIVSLRMLSRCVRWSF